MNRAPVIMARDISLFSLPQRKGQKGAIVMMDPRAFGIKEYGLLRLFHRERLFDPGLFAINNFHSIFAFYTSSGFCLTF